MRVPMSRDLTGRVRARKLAELRDTGRYPQADLVNALAELLGKRALAGASQPWLKDAVPARSPAFELPGPDDEDLPTGAARPRMDW
jgi:hypothetical protein